VLTPVALARPVPPAVLPEHVRAAVSATDGAAADARSSPGPAGGAGARRAAARTRRSTPRRRASTASRASG
jgi:hypothetical protein